MFSEIISDISLFLDDDSRNDAICARFKVTIPPQDMVAESQVVRDPVDQPLLSPGHRFFSLEEFAGVIR
jgi:hypothetical protein